MNKNYTRITYQDMLQDFTARLKNDERFKNMSSASIYYLFMEMLTATMDMTNFYMQRTADECFIDTARLDSSVIKHGKNLGYNPIRKTPAEAEIKVTIKGPLPKSLLGQNEATIYFSQEETDLSFNNNKFILNTDYSYLLTRKDIEDGQSATWSKTLEFSVPIDSMKYFELQNVKMYDDTSLVPIKIFQGEVKYQTIKGSSNLSKLGKSYQFYDIDDIEFSNWYSKRDPNGWFNNKFYNKNSWTKVGIGKNQEEALSDENIFEIEDSSIYLNSKLLSNEVPSKLLKICSITTNSDKTVRLRFGDGNIVHNGLNTDEDNIYIKYLVCNGYKANKIGCTGSELKVNNRFYATCTNGIIDVTNNIKLILNSDITGGLDFESQQSIKINAPMYYASNNRLVTKQDFISYFTTLNTPLKVKNAIAWSQDEIENGGNTTYKYIQNIICYCLASKLYNTEATHHYPINVLTDSNTNTNGTFSLYGTANDYLTHLTDFIKMLKSFDSFIATQYTDNPTPQWLKNIKTIRNNAEHKMLINSKLVSLPPIVHYYDVVGSVTIDSLSKMQEYIRTVENEIYEWLDNNCNFGQKIYKSDIIKFFNKHEETSNVDIDIKVSDIIKSEVIKYTYSSVDNIFSLEPNNLNTSDKNETDKNNWVNIFNFPMVDDGGNKLDKSKIENKYCNIIITYKNNTTQTISFTPADVYENNDSITLTYIGYTIVNKNDVQKVFLEIPATNDFYSLSNYSKNNKNYGLNDFNYLTQIISEWLKNATTSNEASRAIKLPYTISVGDFGVDSITRDETILRRGSFSSDYKNQLSEKSFWLYVVPNIIEKCYPNADLKDIFNADWQKIDTLIFDLYTLFKVTFADSILDDNNNIVNYSMDNEIPVIRLNITYKYGD